MKKAEIRIWKKRSIWLYFFSKTKPEEGKSPNVNDYVVMEKQYMELIELIGIDKIDSSIIPEEPSIDRALDLYNEHKDKWKNGNVEIKSINVIVDDSGLLLINEIEKAEGFIAWVDEKIITNIKNLVEQK